MRYFCLYLGWDLKLNMLYFIYNWTGKVVTSVPYYVHPFNDMLIKTIKELSHEFPFKLDMNNESSIDVSTFSFE